MPQLSNGHPVRETIRRALRDGKYEKTITFVFPGTVATGSHAGRIHAPRAMTVENVTAAVGTAPTGASLIVDVNKGGTTIFTTQGNRPTITAGNTEDLTAIPDVTAIDKDDVITCDVDQVGSSVAGEDLIVQVRCVVQGLE